MFWRARHGWAASVVLVAAVPSLALAQTLMEDDFESFQLLKASPPGKWDGIRTQGAGSSVTISPGSAHRGDGGVLAFDNDTGSSNQPAQLYVYLPAPISGGVYLRYWARVSGSFAAGARVAVSMLGGVLLDGGNLSAGGGDTFADVALTLSPLGLALRGYDATGNYANDPVDAGFPLDAWHLVEVGTAGLNTDAGSRRIWVDRQFGAPVAHLLQGVLMDGFSVGEPWAFNGSFTGQIDVDDVRLTRQAPASAIGVELDAGLVGVGACVPVQVVLLDSANQPAGAPYDLVAGVEADGGSGTFYADTACTVATGSISVDAGLTSAVAYFRPASIGTIALSAAHPDFFSLSAAPLAVSGSGAGPLLVGCDCSTAAPAAAWIAVAVAAMVLRRGARRART